MPKTPPRRPRANWKALREALWTRSGGRCEVSGKPLDPDTFDAHHRRNKGMGGTYRPDTDTLPNLLALDPIVHNGGPGSVHDNRMVSGPRGWLVPKLSTDALNMLPVLVWAGPGLRQWVLLSDAGGKIGLGPILPIELIDAGRSEERGQHEKGFAVLSGRMAGKSTVHTAFTREQLRQLTHGEWLD